jgi:hypothetical protein
MAMVILAWLVMAPPLTAEIHDVRKEIAQQSERDRAIHFPDGHLPPKHDWRNQRPLLRGETQPPPGGWGYGFIFNDGALFWTNSTVADYYVIAPTFLGGNVQYLYLTSTCRAPLGTESLVEYQGNLECLFMVYDWARYPANPNPWVVTIDLPGNNHPYLTTRPDEFGVMRQMVHVRNGTYYLGFNGIYNWQNRVMLFNFNRGDWDLIYSYNYTTLTFGRNLIQNGGFNWGPIVETFGTYTNVNPVGFDLVRLFQDDNPSPFWLNTNNSYVTLSAPWQVLTVASNTSYTVAVSSTNLNVDAYNLGTLCVTASTNAASFSLNPSAGMISSNWVITPSGNSWEKTVVDLSPGDYSITFNPVPGLATPAPQSFTITNNNITMVQAYYDSLVISPANGFTSGGLFGGPFSVTNRTFSLSNSTGSPLNWLLTKLPPWLNATAQSGTLEGFGQTNVTISLTSMAAVSAIGNYTASVTFAHSAGTVQSRQFTLQVQPLDTTQLIQNGGFETGDFTSWTVSPSLGTNFPFVATNTTSLPPHSGNCAVALGGSNLEIYGGGALFQLQLPTLAGQSYLLSFWLESTANPTGSHQTTPNSFSVVWGPRTLFSASNLGTFGWTNMQFVVTARGNGNDQLRFNFRDRSWYLTLDDVSVTPIFVPTFRSITQTNNLAWLGLIVPAGVQYQVQYAADLTQGSWVNMESLVTTTNTINPFVTTSNVIGTDPQRFYRINWAPAH